MHAANADAAERRARRAPPPETPPKHRARALWGLSFAAENLKSPESTRHRVPGDGVRLGAARERRRPPTPPARGARLCAEARGRDARARRVRDAEALAASAGTGPGLIAARTATFARTVAAEARLGAARLGESSSALGSADVRAREAIKNGGSIQNTSAPTRPFLDADGLFQATARARANVHARPWCVLARGELASLLSAYETSRVFSFSASRVVPEASYANTGHARASLVSAAESHHTRRRDAAAAALAATPAGAGAGADADADAIGRRLARAIRAHPACASAPSRARSWRSSPPRAAAGEKSDSFLPARRVFLRDARGRRRARDARLATSLLAAAAEARAGGGDAQAAAALAAKASAAGAGADATARRLAAAQERRCASFLRENRDATSDVTSDEGAYRDACGVSVLDPESDAFATAARLASATAALAAGDSGRRGVPARAARACAASVARGAAGPPPPRASCSARRLARGASRRRARRPARSSPRRPAARRREASGCAPPRGVRARRARHRAGGEDVIVIPG